MATFSKLPQASNKNDDATSRLSDRNEIDAFLSRVKQTKQPISTDGVRGRLIFAMDATMSRQPTWDMALKVQSEMFRAVQALGGLDVQLVFFRGLDECRSSRWVDDAETLARLMSKVTCEGGYTQIRKVLLHTLRTIDQEKANALVYVGDAMEENIDELCDHAGRIGLLGVPIFLFQEGEDLKTQHAFQEIARLTRGATCRFGPGAAADLAELLKAVAVYATGGRAALTDFATHHRSAAFLLEQLSKR